MRYYKLLYFVTLHVILAEIMVRLTLRVKGLLGAEALLYKLRLEFDLLTVRPLVLPLRPDASNDSGDKYFSFIFRFVRPFTERDEAVNLSENGCVSHFGTAEKQYVLFTSARVILDQKFIKGGPSTPNTYHERAS